MEETMEHSMEDHDNHSVWYEHDMHWRRLVFPHRLNLRVMDQDIDDTVNTLYPRVRQ